MNEASYLQNSKLINEVNTYNTSNEWMYDARYFTDNKWMKQVSSLQDIKWTNETSFLRDNN